MQKLSVVIPTFNCSEKLKRCLETVSWAFEIIIVDMGSNDKTVEVAKAFGAKVFTRIPEDGNFDTNRKFGMENATGDWILKLDSDEILSLELAQEVREFLIKVGNEEDKGNGGYVGYNLYNRTVMFGKQVNHGFVKKAAHELRLFKKGHWKYDPYRFHQLITAAGKTSFFKNYYVHYVYETVSEFFQKTNRYTTLDAGYIAKERKITPLSAIIAPFKSFTKLYFFQEGYLDGKIGFIVSYLFALYNLIEKVKIWELKRMPAAEN